MKIRHITSCYLYRCLIIVIATIFAASNITMGAYAAPDSDDANNDLRWTNNDFYSANNINYYSDCVSNSDNSDDSDSSSSGGNSGQKYTADQVKKFAGFSVGALFGVSDDQAEKWFLKSGTAVISRYGLNSGNINQVTKAVKSQGVSPAFFYSYTVNEGGGAGGFINHYAAGSMPGTAVEDAKMDAKYLHDTSRKSTFPPANGGGINIPSDNIAVVKKFLDTLPMGSIGKVYLVATSAATDEMASYLGKSKVGSYGNPLADSMSAIAAMGGDPLTPGKDISEGLSGSGSDSNDSNEECNTESADNPNIDGYVFPYALPSGKTKQSDLTSWYGVSPSGMTKHPGGDLCDAKLAEQGQCHHGPFPDPAIDFTVNESYKQGTAYQPKGEKYLAIHSGTIKSISMRHGNPNCYDVTLMGDDGWSYWYGHGGNWAISNLKEGQTVKAGDQINVMGVAACADNTSPHEHIDRGSPKGAQGGIEGQRDKGMPSLMNKLFKTLPE